MPPLYYNKPMEKSKVKFLAADIAECALFIALMVAAAFIKIPFPPVPLTFQTAVAVLSGLLLGAKKGAISMAIYCFMGLIGIPVFANGGGIMYVASPTFGYIIGFIASAFVAGLIARDGTSVKRVTVAAVVAFLADYIIGAPYCIVAAYILEVKDLWGLLITGNLIYMPKDFALCILAGLIARSVRPAINKLHG